MSDNSKVLLLGNGIYRAFHGEEESWESMLGHIKNEFKREGIVLNLEPSALRSYTLYFEYLYACWKKSKWKSKNQGNEIKMWGEFSGKLQEYLSEKYDSPEYTAYSDYINRLIWKHYNVVLTTNIDCRLERSNEDGKPFTGEWNSSCGGKTTYSVFRLKAKEQKKIFYMHGSVDKKRSICFGLNHYLGGQKCQDDCLHGLLDQERKVMLQLLTEEEVANESRGDINNSWLYYFLSNDVDIVGQGLSNDEIDIWWVMENRFHYKQICDSREGKFKNENNNQHNIIRYFYPSIEMEKNKSKLEMLRAFDIVPVVIPCSTYREFYKIYFDEFAGENT